MVFPSPMRITACNAQVRVNPERLRLDPYGTGWLFEGSEVHGSNIRAGLLTGDLAREWMSREVGRMTELIRRLGPSESASELTLASDGGVPVAGAVKQMRRKDIPHFLEELFNNEEAV